MNRQDIFKICLTAFGLVFIFPPFRLGVFAFIVLTPLFSFIETKSFKTVLSGGFVVGLIWGTGTIYWIGWATVLGVTGTLLVFASYWALFSILMHWLVRRWGREVFWTTPVLWTGYEMFIAFGPMAFPWNSLAYTQSYTLDAIQFISFTGSHGITFWIVLINVLFYFLIHEHWKTKRFRAFAMAIVVFLALPWIHGSIAMNRPQEISRPVRVSLIQGNIDPYKKWTTDFVDSNYTIYQDLSRLSAESKPDLIVWPETAAPSYLRRQYQYLRPIKHIVDSLQTPILTGAPDYEWIDKQNVKTYNAAFLIQPEGWHLDRYYKMRLVPFSERVPFMQYIPFLYEFSKKFTLDIGSFNAGDSIHVFSTQSKSLKETIRFATLICYDSVFPQLAREFVQRGAEFLVIITNDGWFGPTSGPYQHAQIAVLRAIENGIWVARCANTGISEFINPFGMITQKTRLNETAILTESIDLKSSNTFFVKYGRRFPIIMWGVCGMIIFCTLIPLKKIRTWWIPQRKTQT
ncbi:apolipoprotein N-acyltransferase [candidate division KSB1 bacterium]|nr:apolipoprotein N-acyltransferase [candidate division KSB1 bacterium]